MLPLVGQRTLTVPEELRNFKYLPTISGPGTFTAGQSSCKRQSGVKPLQTEAIIINRARFFLPNWTLLVFSVLKNKKKKRVVDFMLHVAHQLWLHWIPVCILPGK